MLWHIVKFIYRPDVSDEERTAAEDAIRGLPGLIEEIDFQRLGRSVDEDNVSAVVVGFADAEAMKTYDAHPAHVPAAERIDGLCAEVVRVDIVTDDEPGAIPRVV